VSDVEQSDHQFRFCADQTWTKRQIYPRSVQLGTLWTYRLRSREPESVCSTKVQQPRWPWLTEPASPGPADLRQRPSVTPLPPDGKEKVYGSIRDGCKEINEPAADPQPTASHAFEYCASSSAIVRQCPWQHGCPADGRP
jgi:hypothetical protein